MRPRSIAYLLAIVAAVGGGLWTWRSISVFEDQINNLETFKTYIACLEAHRKGAGEFPSSIDEIDGCFKYVHVSNGVD